MEAYGGFLSQTVRIPTLARVGRRPTARTSCTISTLARGRDTVAAAAAAGLAERAGTSAASAPFA